MAQISSFSILKKLLQDALVEAVDMMAEQIEEEVDNAVADYYQSYKPDQYMRTGNLGQAPKHTKASVSGDGASAEVYMDTNIKYYTGTWGMQEVVDTANNLLHGGREVGSGVAIWTAPMKTVESKSKQMWLRALQDAGIPVE